MTRLGRLQLGGEVVDLASSSEPESSQDSDNLHVPEQSWGQWLDLAVPGTLWALCGAVCYPGRTGNACLA